MARVSDSFLRFSSQVFARGARQFGPGCIDTLPTTAPSILMGRPWLCIIGHQFPGSDTEQNPRCHLASNWERSLSAVSSSGRSFPRVDTSVKQNKSHWRLANLCLILEFFQSLGRISTGWMQKSSPLIPFHSETCPAKAIENVRVSTLEPVLQYEKSSSQQRMNLMQRLFE
jgi:hypothetical protein